MSFFNTPLLDNIQAKTQWLTFRSSVIAENVAKANVPGFTQKKVQGFSAYMKEMDMRKKVKISPTDHGRYVSNPDPGAMVQNPTIIDRHVQVDPEKEMVESAQVASELQTLTSFFKKYMDMYKKIIARSGGGS
jgi:flagellar basal-body rod protein FlgB